MSSLAHTVLESGEKKLITFSLKVKVMNTIPKIFSLLSQNKEQNQKIRYSQLIRIRESTLIDHMLVRKASK